jgi:hypothetical protein
MVGGNTQLGIFSHAALAEYREALKNLNLYWDEEPSYIPQSVLVSHKELKNYQPPKRKPH